jgi:membrane associated rhomboid family serine protease
MRCTTFLRVLIFDITENILAKKPLILVLIGNLVLIWHHLYWLVTKALFFFSLVQQRQWWVVFTATFTHASRSHLIVNLTLLLAVSLQVEAEVGGVLLLVLYFSTGAAGWALTCLNSYLRFAGNGWEWISSCGASPSTYGLGSQLFMSLITTTYISICPHYLLYFCQRVISFLAGCAPSHPAATLTTVMGSTAHIPAC